MHEREVLEYVRDPDFPSKEGERQGEEGERQWDRRKNHTCHMDRMDSSHHNSLYV